MKLRPLGVYAFLYLAFLYVPVLLLPIFSFNDSSIVAFPLKGFTSLWYAELWHNDTMHGALWNSLKVAIACSVVRSEEHTSELQSLMRISYAVFCLKKKKMIEHNEVL